MGHRKVSVVFTVIILAQFLGTSLWFAGNALVPVLQARFGWAPGMVASVTSSTQFGFIIGTLVFAWLGLADRFSPSRLFFVSSILAALSNMIAVINLESTEIMMTSRFCVGFFLAGIYPVGMKIASDWKAEGLGLWLGALVGALVLGTAFPHLGRSFLNRTSPEGFMSTLSLMAVAGGALLWMLVPDGPFRKPGSRFSFIAIKSVFNSASFRSAAFGYFGHMWELYAFWAFVPVIVASYTVSNFSLIPANLQSFLFIGVGVVSCVVGGIISSYAGSFRVAQWSLIISGLCCLSLSVVMELSPALYFIFMLVWGAAVIADSPQFSSLVARNAPPESRGAAITLVTSIGFAVTIISINTVSLLLQMVDIRYAVLILAIGPAFGLISMQESRH